MSTAHTSGGGGGAAVSFDNPGNSAVGDVADAGVDTDAARADHRHGREAFAAPAASAVGDAQTTGVATSVPHSDHKHAREAFAVPITQAAGDAATEGVATTIPRSDHKHGMPAGDGAAGTKDFRSLGTGAAQAAAGNHTHTGAPLGIAKASDETVANDVTLSNDAALVLAFEASSIYSFELFIEVVNGAETADFKFDFAYSGTGTGAHKWTMTSNAALDDTGYETDVTVDVSCISGLTSYVVHIVGSLITTTAGNFNFRWAQNSNQGVNTTVKAGSWMMAHKLA